MITHFYSDPHFGHINIIKYAGRPFADVHEMDHELMRRYTAAVRDSDLVLWCGDVSFHDEEHTRYILNALPGRKILVRGNHDGTLTRCVRLPFELVADALHFTLARRKVTCMHYPPLSGGPLRNEPRPPKPGPGEFVIHGHSHIRERRIGRRIHVGVDAWDYAPVPVAAVVALMDEVQS